MITIYIAVDIEREIALYV